MRSRRNITAAIVCTAALAAAMPAAAQAGSLLSGYGGPGQGSQVILGASLVNGPRGGGGSQGGGGSRGSSSQTGGGLARSGESSAAASGNAVSGTGSSSKTSTSKRSGAGKRARTPSGRANQVKGAVGADSGGVATAYPASPASAAVRSGGEGSDALGVSGMDLLYILLALGALILTGVLTKRIAGASAPAGNTGS